MNQSRKLQLIIVVIACVFLLGIGIVIGLNASPKTTLADEVNPQASQQHIDINKTFSFPVTDQLGQPQTTIGYTVLSVDKQNQVIVKSQRVSALTGRMFFVINIKLTNASNQAIQLNSRDYVRLSIGKSTEMLAADLYNDPIIIQPISTEYTKLGFPIEATENHFILHVGEINGSKTEIPINFK